MVVRRLLLLFSLLLSCTRNAQEAEVLCDRVGIMSAGELRCIGSSSRLKKRFGAGYTIALTSSSDDEDALKGIQQVCSFAVAFLPAKKQV